MKFEKKTLMKTGLSHAFWIRLARLKHNEPESFKLRRAPYKVRAVEI